MATNNVNYGGGYATGMFYHAPVNTALPAYPTATLASAWEEVGYVGEDGITFSPSIASDQLKDWSRTIRRTTPTEDSPTVQVPIISTTSESLKTVFGSESVTAATASSSHGATATVTITANTMPDAEAFLFIGKDGDDSFMLGTTKGYISAVDDITFVPGDPITWNATIAADSWTFMKDDGQKTT